MDFFRELLMMLGIKRGTRCQHCGVRPGRHHLPHCETGKWDGGVWA